MAECCENRTVMDVPGLGPMRTLDIAIQIGDDLDERICDECEEWLAENSEVES